MGKKKSSKNKNHTGTVATNMKKEATNASVSDRIRDEEHERKRTASDKKTTTIGPASEGASQTEANSKSSNDEGASQADEQCKDLQFYKNKIKAVKANLKAAERKCDEKDSVIKEKEKEIDNLKTENFELRKILEDLKANYKIEVKKQLYSLPDSETSPMDVDTPQVDICEQQNGRGRDIHPQTLQKQNQSNTLWDVGQPSTSRDVQQPSTSLDLQQPCTSSHDEHWDEGKQHTRRGSQLDMQEKRHHFAEHKQHNLDYRQSRTQQNWNERTRNPNYKGCPNPKHGGFKVEPPAVYKIVMEVTGDLFEAPEDNSLAHCVAEDLRMGSGIAVRFRQKFNHVDELLDQKKKQGNVAVLQDTERYIYYLITKRVSTGKPTMDTLRRSLLAMREHVAAHNVSKIAMPRIGCGLDRLDWNKVKPLIEDVFSGLNVTVTVYNYYEDDAAVRPTNYSCLILKEATHPVAEIGTDTAILCLSAADGSIDPVLDSLDRKFHILSNYHCATKNLGSVLDIIKYSYLICILFVKDKKDDELSFKLLAQSLVQARKLIDKHDYYYVALEAFYDKRDELIMEKVMTILRNFLITKHKKELWICRPGNDSGQCKTRLHFQTHTR